MRRLIYLHVFLLLWAAPTAPAEAKFACPAGFARLWQSVRELIPGHGAAAALEESIASGFEIKALDDIYTLEEWRHWGDVHVSRRELLARLPLLRPTERARLIEHVRAGTAANPAAARFKETVLLGLYDPEAWKRIVNELEGGTQLAEIAGKYLPELTAHMPENVREDVLRDIGGRYWRLSKDRLDERNNDMGPKRIADLYFKFLLRGDKLITDAIRAGASPNEAFANYAARVQSYLPESGPPLFTPEQTLETLRRLQKAWALNVRVGMRGRAGSPAVVYVPGSFANGRATIKNSDLDLATNAVLKPSMENYIQKSLNDYVQRLDQNSQFFASYHSEKPEFWQAVHPVLFELRADGFSMLVYDLNGAAQSYPLR